MPEDPKNPPPDFRVAVIWVIVMLGAFGLLLFGSCEGPLDIEQPVKPASAR